VTVCPVLFRATSEISYHSWVRQRQMYWNWGVIGRFVAQTLTYCHRKLGYIGGIKHDAQGQKDCSTRQGEHHPWNKTQLENLPSPSSSSSHFLPLSLLFLSHSFILSLLSRKVVAFFHSLPWARGEQSKHTLLPWIRVRNPIRPSSSYSFSFSFTHCFWQGREGGL